MKRFEMKRLALLLLLVFTGCSAVSIASKQSTLQLPTGYQLIHAEQHDGIEEVYVATPATSDLRSDAIALYPMSLGLSTPLQVVICIQAPPEVVADVGFSLAACTTSLWFNVGGQND
jgi:hypothetical protein